MKNLKMFEIYLDKAIGVGIHYDFKQKLFVVEILCFVFTFGLKDKFGFNFINIWNR